MTNNLTCSKFTHVVKIKQPITTITEGSKRIFKERTKMKKYEKYHHYLATLLPKFHLHTVYFHQILYAENKTKAIG